MRDPATSSAAEVIGRHWAKQRSLKWGPAAGGREIAEFEARHRVKLPGDFAEYIAQLNGIPAPSEPESWKGVEAEGFSFNSLAMLRPMPQAQGYFVFCNWELGLLPFAICLDPNGRHGEVIASREGLSHSRFIAPSFTAFALLYVEDSMRIYGGGAQDA